MILDLRLSRLEQAARKRAESQTRLASLIVEPVESDLPLAVVEQARLRYEQWAEVRRAEINLTLARQTAEWLLARDAARVAFGRAEALKKLRGGA